jgi:peroxiredoxin Q/BCP
VRDALPDLTAAGVAVIGISPDPMPQQKEFGEKLGLDFPLICDTDHRIAEAYGVWAERQMAGKTFMGIVRSAFLVDETGAIAATGYDISPQGTVPALKEWLKS